MKGQVQRSRSCLGINLTELFRLVAKRLQLRLHELSLNLDDVLERLGFAKLLNKFERRGDILLRMTFELFGDVVFDFSGASAQACAKCVSLAGSSSDGFWSVNEISCLSN